jgi:hypothetical protein
MEKRFYVYRIFDGFETVYIGKGSGRRLANQKRRFRLPGEIISWFKSEREAYAHEIKMISALMPTENRHPGGGGSRAQRIVNRRFAWEYDFESVGPRKYAAQELLKFDLSQVLDASKIEAIRQVANGPRL